LSLEVGIHTHILPAYAITLLVLRSLLPFKSKSEEKSIKRMNSILSAIGLSGSRIPQFPYTLDESCEPVRCQFLPTITWLLQDGIASNSEPASPGSAAAAPRRVSVFHISLAELQPEDRELARNAMMRAKKLRIQGMIRCHAAVEHKNHLYIATDRCRPLDDFLLKPRAKDGHHSISEVANGVKGICKGLHSIHVNGLVHGNVFPCLSLSGPSLSLRLKETVSLLLF